MRSWRPSVRWAARGVLALWLPYAALNTFFPGLAVTYGGAGAGELWGRRPQRDGTALYAAAEHALFPIIVQ